MNGVGTLLSEVELEEVCWHWEGRIPYGKITSIDGNPGTGKTAMTIDLAARTSAGFSLPDGTPCEPAGVVLMVAEDGLADTIRPRLEAAGGDPSRVVALQTVGVGDAERLPMIPDDLPLLRRAIERVEAALVVIDPLMAYLSPKLDSHRDQDVRRALAPLARLAGETGAAVVVIRHLNKNAGGDPLYRGGGSIGIIGAARSGLLVAKHPEDEERRILAPLKTNLSKSPPSLAFRLEEADYGALRVRWCGESSLSADQLLTEPVGEERREQLAGLRGALVALLEGSGGSWEGSPKELHEALLEQGDADIPDRPDELSKLVLEAARNSSRLKVARSRKRHGEKVVRVLKLRLVEDAVYATPRTLDGVHGGNGEHKSEDVNTANTDTESGDSVHTPGGLHGTGDEDEAYRGLPAPPNTPAGERSSPPTTENQESSTKPRADEIEAVIREWRDDDPVILDIDPTSLVRFLIDEGRTSFRPTEFEVEPVLEKLRAERGGGATETT